MEQADYPFSFARRRPRTPPPRPAPPRRRLLPAHPGDPHAVDVLTAAARRDAVTTARADAAAAQLAHTPTTQPCLDTFARLAAWSARTIHPDADAVAVRATAVAALADEPRAALAVIAEETAGGHHPAEAGDVLAGLDDAPTSRDTDPRRGGGHALRHPDPRRAADQARRVRAADDAAARRRADTHPHAGPSDTDT